MKSVLRLTIMIIIIGHIVGFIVAPYFSPKDSSFQTKDWIIFIWTGLYFISIFTFWGFLFYHWGVNEFENKSKKRMWFWIILLGGVLYLIGPIIYYFIVVEKGKGLKNTLHNSPA